jgi:hypothetical protein
MTPDRKRRNLFLALIDALLEHVQMNTRMDIRDRIAALALVDRVLAREKPDESDRGSAVRKYQSAFPAAHGSSRRAADPRQEGRPEPDDERGDDDGESDDRAAHRAS